MTTLRASRPSATAARRRVENRIQGTAHPPGKARAQAPFCQSAGGLWRAGTRRSKPSLCAHRQPGVARRRCCAPCATEKRLPECRERPNRRPRAHLKPVYVATGTARLATGRTETGEVVFADQAVCRPLHDFGVQVGNPPRKRRHSTARVAHRCDTGKCIAGRGRCSGCVKIRIHHLCPTHLDACIGQAVHAQPPRLECAVRRGGKAHPPVWWHERRCRCGPRLRFSRDGSPLGSRLFPMPPVPMAHAVGAANHKRQHRCIPIREQCGTQA